MVRNSIISTLNSPISDYYSARQSNNPVEQSPVSPTFVYRFDDLPPRIETMLMSACTEAMIWHLNDAKVEIQSMRFGRNAKLRLSQIERELIVAETMNIDVRECKDRIVRLNWIIDAWEKAVLQKCELTRKKRRLEEELETITMKQAESNKRAKAWLSEFGVAAAAPWATALRIGNFEIISPLNSPISDCYSARQSNNPVEQSPVSPTFVYRFDDLPPRIESMLMSACTEAMISHLSDAKVEIQSMRLGRNAKLRLSQIEREMIVAETMNIDVRECKDRIERLNWIIDAWDKAVLQEWELTRKKRRLEEELETITMKQAESNKRAKAWSSEFGVAAAAPWATALRTGNF